MTPATLKTMLEVKGSGSVGSVPSGYVINGLASMVGSRVSVGFRVGGGGKETVKSHGGGGVSSGGGGTNKKDSISRIGSILESIEALRIRFKLM
jgi:hypothetical protein